MLTLLSTFMGAVQFYYIGRFVGEGREYPLLAPYGGNLLAYLIIGTTFMTFVGVSLDSFSSAIRVEQQMGTLEFLLLSRTSLGAVLLYSGVWNFVSACISTTIVLGIFVFALGVKLNANIVLTFGILFLVVISVGGIGWMSAGMIMVTKQGGSNKLGFWNDFRFIKWSCFSCGTTPEVASKRRSCPSNNIWLGGPKEGTPDACIFMGGLGASFNPDCYLLHNPTARFSSI